MLLDEIIGNDHIKEYLRVISENKKVPNTLIFSGKDGIGKSIFALFLASKLMYQTIKKEDILRIKKNIHSDLYIYKPDGKTYSHNIKSIRELIKNAKENPFEASARIFIIEDAHLMNDVCSNALLKTLEEPLLNTYIILLTSKIEQIIPTILSRASLIRFKDVLKKDIEDLLKKWGKTQKESEKIASLADGSVARACEIASFVDMDDKTKVLLDMLSKGVSSYADLKKQIDYFIESEDIEKQKKDIEMLFIQIFLWYKDLFFIKNRVSLDYLFFEDSSFESKKTNNVSPNKVYEYIEDAKNALLCNINPKTCIETLFLRLGVFS